MNVVKKKESIPKHFNTDKEAGDFWDIHSADDYWDEMEEVEMEFDIQSHKFLVPIDDRIYHLVKKQAEANHCTIEQMINKLLDHSLLDVK